MKVKVAQSCPTLQPHDYTVHGILQARILEWVAFPFTRGSSQPGIELRSPAMQADSLPAEPHHASKVMVKILHAKLQLYANQELPVSKLSLGKEEEPDIKLSIFAGS